MKASPSIRLSPTLSLPAVQFASQGNAILGIRDSGKSYTGTWLAERLLDAGIPFVAFDPIGVWRHLRTAGTGPGYDVVVAGGETGDLPLTPESAPEIVRAAMAENIPLVLDLYSMSLSKADWKRIVADSVRLLLYENKGRGLRHIFIEEAAEFVPQRVGPDQGRVYAEIEKLARMGGNASLGYTLINQRAEEVNKAVLELCDCLFLHRQKGRHSLTALGKWLDAADAGNGREIVRSLPTLGQGECWVWPQGTGLPTRVQVPAKRTFHPDRRNPELATAAPTAIRDVSAFVQRLRGAIKKAAAPTPETRSAAPRKKSPSSPPPADQEELHSLRSQVEEQEIRLACYESEHSDLMGLAGILRQLHGDFGRTLDLAERILNARRGAATPPLPTRAPSQTPTLPPRAPEPPEASPATAGEKLPRAAVKALAVLAAHHPRTRSKAQVALQAGYAVGGGGYGNALSLLRTRGFMTGTDPLEITAAGRAAVGRVAPMPTGRALVEFWAGQVSKAERAILETVTSGRRRRWAKEEIAARTGYEATGGGFGNALSRLRTLGLIVGTREIVASEELFVTEGRGN